MSSAQIQDKLTRSFICTRISRVFYFRVKEEKEFHEFLNELICTRFCGQMKMDLKKYFCSYKNLAMLNLKIKMRLV